MMKYEKPSVDILNLMSKTAVAADDPVSLLELGEGGKEVEISVNDFWDLT